MSAIVTVQARRNDVALSDRAAFMRRYEMISRELLRMSIGRVGQHRNTAPVAGTALHHEGSISQRP